MYDIDDIMDVLYDYPRTEWKSKISDMIIREDNDTCIILTNKNDTESEFSAQFHLRSLEPDFRIPFNEGDFIRDSKGKEYFIPYLPALDIRREGDYQYNHIIDAGDKTELVYLDNGTLKYIMVYISPDSTEYTKISEEDLDSEFREQLHRWWNGEFAI